MSDAAQQRLIFALDVPTTDEALGLVDDLRGIVSFHKVGWELFLGGDWRRVAERVRVDGGDVFVDLKVPVDIGNTVRRVVELCAGMGARLLTLSAGVPAAVVEAARRGRSDEGRPELLVVPVVSSLDASDLAAAAGGDVDAHIVRLAGEALAAGCDGVVASGCAIAAVRRAYPDARRVSPGIRPAGSATDEHKRSTTPAEAIAAGADYLVVGRPIRQAGTRRPRREVAGRIVEEIVGALAARGERPTAGR